MEKHIYQCEVAKEMADRHDKELSRQKRSEEKRNKMNESSEMKNNEQFQQMKKRIEKMNNKE